MPKIRDFDPKLACHSHRCPGRLSAAQPGQGPGTGDPLRDQKPAHVTPYQAPVPGPGATAIHSSRPSKAKDLPASTTSCSILRFATTQPVPESAGGGRNRRRPPSASQFDGRNVPLHSLSLTVRRVHEHLLLRGLHEPHLGPARPETSLLMLSGTSGRGLVRVLSPHAGQKSPAPCASPSFLHQLAEALAKENTGGDHSPGPPRRLRPPELMTPAAAVKIGLALRPLDPGQVLWSNGTTTKRHGVLFESAGGAFKKNGKESGGKSGHVLFSHFRLLSQYTETKLSRCRGSATRGEGE